MNWFNKLFKRAEPTLTKESLLQGDTSDITTRIRRVEMDTLEKSKNKKVPEMKAYEEPVVSQMNMNPDYKEAYSKRGKEKNFLHMLKHYSTRNIIFNAIVLTRTNQVSMFCRPSRYSDKKEGFTVRLKDNTQIETEEVREQIREIEDFIQFTGSDKRDFTRDNFTTFIKKLVRDRFIYDKINFELIYHDKAKTELAGFKAVDPSTIYIAVDKDGKESKSEGRRYVQVEEDAVIAEFSAQEMAWEVHNPRTDINVGRYGMPELDQVLNHLRYQENTEIFNERYFSQGGTTRGVLQIRTGQQQSHQALQTFRRDWSSLFSGVDGAWKIPVVSAEDVKFVNMTQSSKDMEFEKWLNYLINVISSVFQIDPAEINFPNRGGATGSSGSTLNESSSDDKLRGSKSKGLEPLVKFLEDTINKYIVSQFSDDLVFNFVGGDTKSEKELMEIAKLHGEAGYTFNEIREKFFGLEPILGGDIVNQGVHIQRLGQIEQETSSEKQSKKDLLQILLTQADAMGDEVNPEADKEEYTPPPAEDKREGEDGRKTEEFRENRQEQGTGHDGSSEKVDGRATTNKKVGKDGQLKSEENTNMYKMAPEKDK